MSEHPPALTDETMRRAKGRHFLLEPSLWPAGGFPKIEFANETRLWRPGWHFVEPPTGAADQYPERPHLLHDPKGRKANGLPRDFEMFAGLWIVSTALKQVFQAVDPEGFAFAACDFTLADGRAGPELHLCGVLRELDALDEAASRVKIKTGDYVNGKYYSRAGGAALVFRTAVMSGAHVFRTPYSDAVFCDRKMRDALVQAGLKGIGLRDATDC